MPVKINKITDYLSLIKFSHTVFALPFAVIGFFMAVHRAQGQFEWRLLLMIVLCMVFARSAAMAFNRYTDRHIDRINPRTAGREIPRGIITPASALIFTVINSALFILSTYFINTVCFILSPIALIIILGYSYTKKFTSLSHLALGAGLSLAPIGAYLAVTAEFAWMPMFISFAVLFWVSGFDIIYALQDEEFDKQHHLKSLPAAMGKKNSLATSKIFHFIAAVFIAGSGIYGKLGSLYWAGALIFIALLVYQQSLVKPNDLSRVNLAFFTLNGIASVIFAVFAVAEIY